MNPMRLLSFSTLVSAALACRCVPGALELETSLENNEDAARVDVEEEITPPRDNVNEPRFWRAKVLDVFQGCGISAADTIVISTGGNSALCGVQLQSSNHYLLVGRATEQQIAELDYKGTALSVSSCTLNTPFASLAASDRQTLYALKDPGCGATTIVGCGTCPLGYYDGCNSCFCGAGGRAGGCTRKYCPPGTETQAYCNCEQDKRECLDGSSVSRDPLKNCQFPECEQRFCTADVKTCPDGSFVSRNPSRGCAFDDCPRLDCETCPSGFYDGCNTCQCSGRGEALCSLRACTSFELAEPRCNPTPDDCTADIKTCPGGNVVSRNPSRGCAFDDCPRLDCETCPFGFYDGCNTCQCSGWGGARCTFRACTSFELEEPRCNPNPVDCTTDVKRCPDGSFVSRNPSRGCAFDDCPRLDCETCPSGFYDGCNTCRCSSWGATFCSLRTCGPFELEEPRCNPNLTVCASDVKRCPDGTFVSRNPTRGCAFDNCPSLNCETCPSGFYDGCNTCRCSGVGAAMCTLRACPFTLNAPRCIP